MMEASGNNVALVMSYSGHKSSSHSRFSFTPQHNAVATDQRIKSIGLFLTSFAGPKKPLRTVGEKGKQMQKTSLS
jgi:hypothetical protein